VQEQEDLGALLSQRLRTVSGARAITSFSKTRKAATRAETPVAACANHGSESVTESISAIGTVNASYPRDPLTARVPYKSSESRLKLVFATVGAFFPSACREADE